MGKFEVTKIGVWHVFNPTDCAVSVSETHRSPVTIARDLKFATRFPGQKCTCLSRLGETGREA